MPNLVVTLEVDPASHPFNGDLPLLGVPHDDAPAMVVVLLNAHLFIIFFKPIIIPLPDVKLLVDLMFYW